MENSSNLLLPYIMPSQAQKHVTHNEAIRALDALVQISVASRGYQTPPVGPEDGVRFIVAPPAGGAWAGQDGKIAALQDAAWHFYSPRDGWLCWCADEAKMLVRQAGDWLILDEAEARFDNVAKVGVNAVADAANRLSVRSAATLLSHEAGSHRLIVNKQSEGETASLILQSGWTGHAEIGLCGGNGLTVRTSADGLSFADALTVASDSGRVRFPNTAVLTDFAMNLYQDSGRLSGNGSGGLTVGAFVFPDYLSLYNGSSAAARGKFIHDNDDYGGTSGALDPEVKSLVDRIRDPAFRRYGLEFWVAEVVQGSGLTAPVTVEGQTFYESLFNAQMPRMPSMTFHAYVRAVDDNILIRPSAGQIISADGAESEAPVVVAPADGWVSVTVSDSVDPRSSFGYAPATFDVYAKTQGDRWLLACPALVGGITRFNDDIGVVAAYNLWSA